MADRLERRADERHRLDAISGWSGPAPSRFDGREPRQFITWYDQAGERCAPADAWEAVIEREPEWLEQDRNQVLGHAAYGRRLCKCGCGQLARLVVRETDDTNVPQVDVHTVRCIARASIDVVQRDDQMADTPEKERPQDYVPKQMQASDGLLYSAALVD